MRALDSVDGLAQKNARMWQIISLVSLSSFFIALGVLIYAVNLPKTIPVIVTVDSTTGKAEYVGQIDKSLYGKEAIPEIAKMARMHNDANVLVMPGRYIPNETAAEIMDQFFNTPFEGGRHIRRIEKIPVTE